ncbi:hypothetical protein [Lentibacillus saliphilus]|uniref:hypothetical protein n=1 Tax=Lentibacillus saliphilus TaxID=2737028 RepID=UPI001C30962F|nr:hypothetical protein [Lentibacillus saliphilus]
MKKVFFAISIILLNIVLFAGPTMAATTHYNQDVTAYVGKREGHGGMLFPNEQYETVAIHQKSSSDRNPIYKFGTTLRTHSALNLPGYGTKSVFTITDTGDLFGIHSRYWFDVYFGTDTTTNRKNANTFGTNNNIPVTYTVYN